MSQIHPNFIKKVKKKRPQTNKILTLLNSEIFSILFYEEFRFNRNWFFRLFEKLNLSFSPQQKKTASIIQCWLCDKLMSALTSFYKSSLIKTQCLVSSIYPIAELALFWNSNWLNTFNNNNLQQTPLGACEAVWLLSKPVHYGR
jgi:hypothetical protein